MNIQTQIVPADAVDEPLQWCARVLVAFAQGEQALGRLCLVLGLSVENGSLSNLAKLRERLVSSNERRCKLLVQRVDRWSAKRPYRHLLAHATLHILTDMQGRQILVTRHLPRDVNDVTPDLMWTDDERADLLKQANADGRSISDHVRNILADAKLVKALKAYPLYNPSSRAP